MKIESQFNQYAVNPTLINILQNNIQKAFLELLCCRIGIVQKFYPEDITADFLVVNKVTKGLNKDGTQKVQDWATIRAKVCYASPHESFPLRPGQECILWFSDREIESWFINGNTNAISHSRMHDETDCIAIAGLRSMPQMIQILRDALHLFYFESDIQLHQTEIISNTHDLTINASDSITQNTKEYELNADDSIKENTKEYEIQADTSYKLNTITQTETATTRNIKATTNNITATTSHTGTLSSTVLVDDTAATGVFVSADNKIITVTNGIVRKISNSGQ